MGWRHVHRLLYLCSSREQVASHFFPRWSASFSGAPLFRHFAAQAQTVQIPLYHLEPIDKEQDSPEDQHSPFSTDDTPVAKWPYTVEVVTGSVRGAGTPNMATMQIFGSSAASALYRIGDDGDNEGGPGFVRDSIKQYSITSPALGTLRRIHIQKDIQRASELGSGWFLERVVVTSPDGSYTTFPCHAWIGEPDDGSGPPQFERNLLPCVKPVVLPIDSGTHQQAISIRGAGVAIPHPEKVKDGKRGVNLRSSGFAGEDAYFYTPGSRDMFGMGVADGVYMWREHGIDAGVFARTLMDTAQHLVEAGYSDVVRIAEICQRKVDTEGIYGSSTFCLAVIDRKRSRMHVACLGDSSIMVIGGTPTEPEPHIKFRTSPQEHEFGHPYQMGHLPSADRPQDCMLASVRVVRGDIVILGSDGLWDNIFDREIAATALKYQAAGPAPNPSALVRDLASTAYARSQDRVAFTPYSFAASEWFDMVYNGGKKDDISVVAAFVE